MQGFLIGAIAMIAPWPWTLLVIKPVNDRLLETRGGQAGRGVARADREMGRRCMRCAPALGAVATAAFLWALMAR